MKQINTPQQQQLNINLGKLIPDAPDVSCEKCGNNKFMSVNAYKKISKLAAGTDQDIMVPIPLELCAVCGEVLNELLPEGLKGKFDQVVVEEDTEENQ